jgi:hydroxypyruvate reductase
VFAQIETAVRSAGYDCMLLGTSVEGEARTVATEHAQRALALRSQGKRAVIVSGGELTVTIHGKGRGGPNQEYMLALAIALEGAAGIAALAGDTDGIDGGGGQAADPAGAFIDSTTIGRARQLGLDPMAYLNANNSTEFFEKLGDLVAPGPTCTNVSDFRSILVDSP